MLRNRVGLFLVVSFPCLWACDAQHTEPKARPDIVLIVVDTLRGEVLTDPEGRYDTPNLDALAQDGVVFPHAFAHAPLTLPSHTAIFSSRPPVESVVFNNGQEVPEELPLLAEHLQALGYETRGVTSLGTLWAPKAGTRLWRGFEDYDLDYWHMSQAEVSYGRMTRSLDARDPNRRLFFFAHFSDPHEPYNAHGLVDHETEVYLDGERLGTVSTADMTFWHRTLELDAGRHTFEFHGKDPFKIRLFQSRVAGATGPWEELEWLQGRRVAPLKEAELALTNGGDGPRSFDLRFWINDVPGNQEVRSRYEREVAYVDHWIGELVADLKRRGLYDDALVVFTADHGESLGEHGRIGHANGLTDPHIHVPLIVKPPKGDPRRKLLERNAKRVVPHSDVTPTILDLAMLSPLPGQRGTTLLRPHSAVHFAETHRPEAKANKLCLRDERYKMIYLQDEDRFLFFDLQSDPGELNDVYLTRWRERAEWPERLRTLARLADERRAGGFVPDAAAQADLEALGYGGGD